MSGCAAHAFSTAQSARNQWVAVMAAARAVCGRGVCENASYGWISTLGAMRRHGMDQVSICLRWTAVHVQEGLQPRAVSAGSAEELGPEGPPAREVGLARVRNLACEVQRSHARVQNSACGVRGSVARVPPPACGVQSSSARAQPPVCGVQSSVARVQQPVYGVQSSDARFQRSVYGVQSSDARVQHPAFGVPDPAIALSRRRAPRRVRR